MSTLKTPRQMTPEEEAAQAAFNSSALPTFNNYGSEEKNAPPYPTDIQGKGPHLEEGDLGQHSGNNNSVLGQANDSSTPSVKERTDTYYKAVKFRKVVDVQLSDLKRSLEDLKQKILSKKAGEAKEEAPAEPPKVELDETLTSLFAITIALSRLVNQKILNKASTIKFNAYYEYFKKLIELYSSMLTIGSVIDFPIGKPKAEEGKIEDKGEKKSEEEVKKEGGGNEETKEEEKGTEEAEGKEEEKDKDKYLDVTVFRHCLKSFHAYLFMNIESNEKLKGFLKNPSIPVNQNQSFELLTEADNKKFGTLQYINILDTLFEHIIDAFFMIFVAFELVVNTRSSVLESNTGLITKFNETISNFNKLENKPIITCDKEPCERPIEAVKGMAMEQSKQLNEMMEKGLVQVPIKNVTEMAIKMTDNAHTIQLDIVKELSSTQSKGVLGRIKNAFTFTKKPDAKQSQNMKQVAQDIFTLGGTVYSAASQWKSTLENVIKTVPSATDVQPAINELQKITTTLGIGGNFHTMLQNLNTTLNLPLQDIPEIKVPQKDLEDLKKQMTALIPLLQGTRSNAISRTKVNTAVQALLQKIETISKLLPAVVTPPVSTGQSTAVKQGATRAVEETGAVTQEDELAKVQKGATVSVLGQSAVVGSVPSRLESSPIVTDPTPSLSGQSAVVVGSAPPSLETSLRANGTTASLSEQSVNDPLDLNMATLSAQPYYSNETIQGSLASIREVSGSIAIKISVLSRAFPEKDRLFNDIRLFVSGGGPLYKSSEEIKRKYPNQLLPSPLFIKDIAYRLKKIEKEVDKGKLATDEDIDEIQFLFNVLKRANNELKANLSKQTGGTRKLRRSKKASRKSKSKKTLRRSRRT